jgi:hypothetical protein
VHCSSLSPQQHATAYFRSNFACASCNCYRKGQRLRNGASFCFSATGHEPSHNIQTKLALTFSAIEFESSLVSALDVSLKFPLKQQPKSPLFGGLPSKSRSQPGPVISHLDKGFTAFILSVRIQSNPLLVRSNCGEELVHIER